MFHVFAATPPRSPPPPSISFPIPHDWDPSIHINQDTEILGAQLILDLDLQFHWFLSPGQGILSSRVDPYVCLSIQLLLPFLHYWHQTITAYLPCPVLVPLTIILALQPLTLAQWPWTFLVTSKLPKQNITSMPKRYICCILPISQMSSKGSDFDWPLTQLIKVR